MLEWSRAAVPAFLAAQALLVYLLAGRQQLPTPPVLSRVPAAVGHWSLLRDDPLDPDLVNVLHADRLLSRIYVDRAAGSLANLFVAWFQTQRGGQSQPHSPKVCLPASGWAPRQTGEINIDTAAGMLTVNRYVVANGAERAVVLYWYQTPRRAIAGEWASKFWLIVDGLRDNRTDAALVRIIVWSAAGGEDLATATASNFAAVFYPALHQQLPATR